jgi:hypothetical protein
MKYKAEDYVSKWCDDTYKGGKELGDWTTNEVMKFANDYAQMVVSKISSNLPVIGSFCDHPEEFRSQTGIDTEECDLCQTEL